MTWILNSSVLFKMAWWILRSISFTMRCEVKILLVQIWVKFITISKLLVYYLGHGLNSEPFNWPNCFGPFEYQISYIFRSPLYCFLKWTRSNSFQALSFFYCYFFKISHNNPPFPFWYWLRALCTTQTRVQGAALIGRNYYATAAGRIKSHRKRYYLTLSYSPKPTGRVI